MHCITCITKHIKKGTSGNVKNTAINSCRLGRYSSLWLDFLTVSFAFLIGRINSIVLTTNQVGHSIWTRIGIVLLRIKTGIRIILGSHVSTLNKTWYRIIVGRIIIWRAVTTNIDGSYEQMVQSWLTIGFLLCQFWALVNLMVFGLANFCRKNES